MAKFFRYLLEVLFLLTLVNASRAFYMHKIMAAALLANSLQRNAFLPLPIPIPIPVKAGGNTIIAMADDDHYDAPIHVSCGRPPCYSGHKRRLDFFWG